MDILGVRVDKVTSREAIERVKSWLVKKDNKKRYIVTPNIEFILDAQRDSEFKRVLNEANLAIPDSAHLVWASQMLETRSWWKKLVLLPGFLFPADIVLREQGSRKSVSTDTLLSIPGVDLMEALISLANEKSFTVGFLGGGDMVSKKTAECLKKKYQNLKVAFAESGGEVDKEGKLLKAPKELKSLKADLLFVAFGHVKQEKWIAKNLSQLDVKVAMGVGGAFDYLSGNVARAPKFMRELGYEWLFRLIIQPWRVKRQLRLVWFIGLVLCHSE